MRRIFTIASIIIVSFIVVFMLTATLITDWFWFKELGYQRVFIISILSKVGLQLIVGIFFFVLFLLNLFIAKRYVQRQPETIDGENVVPLRRYVFDRFIHPKKLNFFMIIVSTVLAFIFSSAASGEWMMVQQFLNRVPFGLAEPIFNKDASFYVFTLQFFRYVYSLVFLGILVSLLLSGVAYFFLDPKNLFDLRSNEINQPRVHLSILLALLFILKASGYILDSYGLLNKPGGVVYGPGYTDVHANLLAYKVLAVVAVLAAVIILINIFLRRFRLVLVTIGALIVISLCLGGVYPFIVQKLQVEPNELAKEMPYIKNNIDFTRKAYGLDDIEIKTFETSPLTMKEISANRGTVENIRLWDARPLKTANSQLQEIRSYYEFKNVDVDRYIINNRLTQVMVAARELDKEKLPPQAQTWVNRKLRYTHGYGVTMNFVNMANEEGYPVYIIKDMPPASLDENIKITTPQIYYGEEDDDYIIVKTKSEEFDYPTASGNVSTNYKGSGGVSISNLWVRALFAFRFADYRILVSDMFTDESRIIFRKNIQERINKIAPFLLYDRDPYIVINEGRLFWIQDAYTTSDSFPYSTPLEGIGNYIRNSVKIVVDAYNGDVTFYADLEKDPIVKTLSRIFPNLFKPMSEMPEGIRKHIRYPEDIFRIQAQIYSIYHMEDIRDFYNREDVWNISEEIFAGEAQPMDPYYTILTLPNENEPEFVLMLPFTPAKKNNMAAWMAVRCDPEHYGEAIVFQFSKQELVFGPMQVEAEIDANSEISEKLSLWSQRGSQVIRGNLLVIPIDNGLLYVEPLFLQAEQGKIPGLRRVILFHEGKVTWAETLDKALTKLFGEEIKEDKDTEPREVIGEEDKPIAEGTIKELIERANQLFQEAKESQRKGDWAAYGEALSRLEEVLKRLAEE